MHGASESRIDFEGEREDALDAINDLGRVVADARGLSPYVSTVQHQDACWLVSQVRSRVAHRVGLYLDMMRARHAADALDLHLVDLDDAEHVLRRIGCGIETDRERDVYGADVASIATVLRQRRCLSCGDTCDVSDLRTDGTCVECERDTDSRTIPVQAVAS